jgi:hypothetical protein
VGHASEATHYQPTQRKGGTAWWIGHRGDFFFLAGNEDGNRGDENILNASSIHRI